MEIGEGIAYQEDKFLTSANLCRWIIDYSQIKIDRQVTRSCSLDFHFLTFITYRWELAALVWCFQGSGKE